MGAAGAAGTVPALVQVQLDQQSLSHPGLLLKRSCRYRQLTADSSPRHRQSTACSTLQQTMSSCVPSSSGPGCFQSGSWARGTAPHRGKPVRIVIRLPCTEQGDNCDEGHAEKHLINRRREQCIILYGSERRMLCGRTTGRARGGGRAGRGRGRRSSDCATGSWPRCSCRRSAGTRRSR